MMLPLVLLLAARTGVATRLYPELNRPSDNPRQQQAWTKVPMSVAGSAERPCLFAAYRGALDSPAALDAYNATRLGTVVWPQYPVLYDPNLSATLDSLVTRGLWLADISNYVPGDMDTCSPTPPIGVCEVRPARAITDLVVAKLGERFTGMDNGEQDGRYMSYTPQQLRGRGGLPSARTSELKESYLQFMRHFQRLTDDLGSRMMSLNSLWFTHYFASTGLYTLIGAETAQGLPNDQIFYAFLRGAAKQYGTRIWGDASVGNRWWGPEGPKECTANAAGTECVCTEMGTSLSLLRRLMYQQLMYNSAIFSFEGGYTCAARNASLPAIIGPIGKIQGAGKAFANRPGGVGVHIAQVGVLLDFFAGYTAPRHLYSESAYRVWGNIPWSSGDFFTHGVLNRLYPGYEASSYFHNEAGFLTSTPHGDTADVLLSDAPAWLLQRYPVLVCAGRLASMRAEVAAKLEAYTLAGGTLVVAADTLRNVPLFGITVAAEGACVTLPRGTVVQVNITATKPIIDVAETVATTACGISFPRGASAASPVRAVQVVAAAGATALAYTAKAGNGTLYVLASSGVASAPDPSVPLPLKGTSSYVDKPLPNPYPLANHAGLLLDAAITPQHVFVNAGGSLSVVTTRVARGEYLVGVSNNIMEQQKLDIVSNVGAIHAMDEVKLADAALAAGTVPGWTPTHTPNGTKLGANTNTTIMGLAQRIFKVSVDESSAVDLLPNLPPLPRPSRAALVLAPGSLQDAVLLRPSFPQHFEHVVVDWQHLEGRTVPTLAVEGRWAHMRSIKTIVDVTSGLNLYPDLRFCNNSKGEYEQSVARVEDVMNKMATLVNASTATAGTAMFSNHLLASLHRTPENYYTDEQCMADFVTTFKRLATLGEKLNITVHIRTGEDNKPPHSLADGLAFLVAAGSPPNLKLAVSTAQLVYAGELPPALGPTKIGLWLAAAPAVDPFNSGLVSVHGSLTTLTAAQAQATASLFSLGGGAQPIILDASLPGADADAAEVEDAEYRESMALKALLVPG